MAAGFVVDIRPAIQNKGLERAILSRLPEAIAHISISQNWKTPEF